MTAKAPLQYRLIFRNATSICRLAKATHFYLKYGKRWLIKKQAFPKKFKVKDKKKLLASVIQKLEMKRLKLQKERKKAAEKRRNLPRLPIPPRAKYKLKLKTAKGKPATLSKAKYYDLFYGLKKVINNYPFPEGLTVAEKKVFLATVIQDVEMQRQTSLERLRERRNARKEAEEVIEDGIEPSDKLKKLLKAERLSKRSRTEVSKTRNTRVLGKVTITPVITGTSAYSKEIITKRLVSTVYDGRHIDIRILDFTLKQAYPVTLGSIHQVKEKLFLVFKPHIDKFFKESKGTKRAFIFRLKFDMPMRDSAGVKIVRHQGVSAVRRITINGLSDKKGIPFFTSHIIETFNRFKNKVLERYLGASINNEIFLTGFTLENIVRIRSEKTELI